MSDTVFRSFITDKIDIDELFKQKEAEKMKCCRCGKKATNYQGHRDVEDNIYLKHFCDEHRPFRYFYGEVE